MPTTNLTHKFLEAATAPDGKRVTWHDENLPDFGVRVSGTTGTKTFFVRYYAPNGARRQKKIGRFPVVKLADARKEARKVLGMAAAGEDPVGEERARRQGLRVKDFKETYVRWARGRKRSWEEDERQLNKDVLPVIGGLLMAGVKRTDLVAVLDRVADRGARVQANRTRALLSKFFRLALERGVIELSPAQALPRYAREEPRNRVLSEAEIEKVWKALAPEHPVTASVFKVALLTGQRTGEVTGMHPGEINGTWWELPASRTKNRQPHRVPLSAEVREVLDALEVVTGPPEPWIFPSPRKGQHIASLGKAASRLRERSGVEFRPHDLRRTAATYMARMGTPRLVISKILNHKDASVTAVYDRASYDQEKRGALDAWGERVRAIVGEL